MIERYAKIYRYIFIICGTLALLGGIMQFFHIEIGISGKLLWTLSILFIFAYQCWFIEKLYKKVKDNKPE